VRESRQIAVVFGVGKVTGETTPAARAVDLVDHGEHGIGQRDTRTATGGLASGGVRNPFAQVAQQVLEVVFLVDLRRVVRGPVLSIRLSRAGDGDRLGNGF
jgi:hypothetical protein